MGRCRSFNFRHRRHHPKSLPIPPDPISIHEKGEVSCKKENMGVFFQFRLENFLFAAHATINFCVFVIAVVLFSFHLAERIQKHGSA
jgi:hypothetical protein